MPTFPSMNLLNPKLESNVVKRVNSDIISTGHIGYLRTNLTTKASLLQMNIITLKNTKPCGRCGGSK